MELRQLRYLTRIAEAGSLGRAAALLRMSQPALSMQLRQLEEELGVRLFSRHHGGMMPTAAGERLVAHSRRILNDVEAAVHDTLEQADRVTGQVAIGLPAPVAMAFGPGMVRSLLEGFPGVRFNLIEGRSTQLETWLLQGELDLAVIYNPTSTPLLLHELLWEEELFLFAAEDSDRRLPRRLADVRSLEGFPLILSASGNTTRQVVDQALGSIGASLDVLLEISSLPTLLALVEEGLGCSILNELCIWPGYLQRRFTLCRLPQPVFSHRLFLSWAAGRTLSRAARELARTLGPTLRQQHRLLTRRIRGR